nr:MAG TPA: hypothetical protein [Caudoviricetes sp.]
MKLIGYREGNYGEKQKPARKKKSPKFAWWVVWNVILRAGDALCARCRGGDSEGSIFKSLDFRFLGTSF